MYEIKQGEREVFGRRIPTFSREIYSANILEVEAGTNGYCGGDCGHGSRTYIRITDLGGTCMSVIPRALGDQGDLDEGQGVEIMLGGDCELGTIIDGLEFILQALKDCAKGEAEIC